MADLVHPVARDGFSYPSRHAVFTWMSFMLAVSIAPAFDPPSEMALWILAALVIFSPALSGVGGRPLASDVLGGSCSAGWSAFVLWPQSAGSHPRARWFRGRARATS